VICIKYTTMMEANPLMKNLKKLYEKEDERLWQLECIEKREGKNKNMKIRKGSGYFRYGEDFY